MSAAARLALSAVDRRLRHLFVVARRAPADQSPRPTRRQFHRGNRHLHLRLAVWRGAGAADLVRDGGALRSPITAPARSFCTSAAGRRASPAALALAE